MITRIFLLFVTFFLLAACGIYGPLYMYEPVLPATTKNPPLNAAPANTTPVNTAPANPAQNKPANK